MRLSRAAPAAARESKIQPAVGRPPTAAAPLAAVSVRSRAKLVQYRQRRGRRSLTNRLECRAGVPIWRGLELSEARCAEEREWGALARCLRHDALQVRGCALARCLRHDALQVRGACAMTRYRCEVLAP
ncbi:uncharacterized protein LOC123407120 [Hordeum vulgare subsp. vulgare]|uniref:uncharacterized protein LOC123407120 n=1 Tax=Hordeum vulgare subsp. vulgare TaxID=112509 RepID=UPI001D1A3982|nr:uncharacterized protein LOC123407120 [Hordeum vulgare subsp. vulgare]